MNEGAALVSGFAELTPSEPGANGLRSPLRKPQIPTNLADLWVTAAELAKRTPSEIDWLIPPIAAQGAVALFDAREKAGKTTFVHAGIHALVNGTEFLGERLRQTPVVYLTEQGDAASKASLVRAGLEHAPNLHILQSLEVRAVEWEKVVAEVWRKCQETGSSIVIVDTLGKFQDFQKSGDENDSWLAQKAYAPLHELASKLNVAVVVVRHLGHSGDHSRGSSQYQGEPDMIAHFKRRDSDNSNSGYRRIEVVGRLIDEELTIDVEWLPDLYTYRRVPDGMNTQEDECAQRLRELSRISRESRKPASELAKIVGFSEPVTRSAAESLVACGAMDTEALEASPVGGRKPKGYFHRD